jgi:hypothetical protein
MDREPIRDDLLEAMEACRSGSEDLRDPLIARLAEQLAANPGLAERLERLQRADAAVKAAFEDVAVPAGLAEQILGRLAAADPVIPEAPTAGIHPLASYQLAPRPARLSRRAWLTGAAVAAMAAAVLLAVVFREGQLPLSRDGVLMQAVQQFAEDSIAAPGELASQAPPPEDYPLSRDVLCFAEVRWRWVNLLGTRAVAYDLSGPAGVRATLYVAHRTVSGSLPARPPISPDCTSGASAAAWMEGKVLCILVVDGNARLYQNYLRPARGTLA